MSNICADQCDCCKEIWNRDNLKMVAIGEHKLSFCPDCFTEYQKTKPDTKKRKCRNTLLDRGGEKGKCFRLKRCAMYHKKDRVAMRKTCNTCDE